jgi:hypothetical protein
MKTERLSHSELIEKLKSIMEEMPPNALAELANIICNEDGLLVNYNHIEEIFEVHE